jgi:hypothetical protein
VDTLKNRFGRRIMIAALSLPFFFVSRQSLFAQTPTYAELRAKVNALETENAGLRRDYQVILSACPATTPSASIDTTATDRLTAAAQQAQQALLDAENSAFLKQQQQELENAAFWVNNVDFSATESNDVFVRYGWKVTIKNGIPRTQSFDLEVQFLDKNDFVIDTAHLYRRTIEAFDQQTFTGDTLVRMPNALRVVHAKAIVTRR